MTDFNTPSMLLLVRGLPGSGKTTLVRTIEALTTGIDVASISADEFFEKPDGSYDFRPEFLPQAHEWCRYATETEMTSGHNLVMVHNTFTQDWEMEPYFELARKHGFICKTIICENRHAGTSVHDVPDASISKMFNRFSINL